MCNRNCREQDPSYRHCRNCLEIMCNDCHDNMDQTPEARKFKLRERHDLRKNHWCWSGEPFRSVEEASSDEDFNRMRIVDWEKINEVFGNGVSFYAYEKREFRITQSERVRFAADAERIMNPEETDWN